MSRILAVDDEPFFIQVITDILSPDYEVITATNGKEAVDAALQYTPALIIMDIAMPVMDGIEATTAIKTDPKTKAIPVLIVTAYGSEEQMVKGLDAGADDYVEKPFSTTGFRARIRALLRTKALYDSLEQVMKDQEILLDVTSSTTSTIKIYEVLHTVTKKIAEHLSIFRCSIIIVDEAKGHGLVIASSEAADIGGMCIYLNKYPEITRVLETMKPLIIEDVTTDPLMAEVEIPPSYKSILVVPILYRDEVIGTLLLTATKERESFTKREADICQMIAHSSANAIKSAFLYDVLEEQKQELESANERLLKLDKLKSNFLAMAAHELRSPLSIINGYLETVLDGETDPISPKATRFLSLALEGGKRLASTIEEILDLSVIESGKLRLDLKEGDIVKVADGVLRFMGKEIQAKGIMVHPPNSGKTAKAVFDHKKIEQVLINLIGNSVKFTPTGGTITITVDETPDDLTLTVSDTGCGIPMDSLNMVFEEFYTGKNSEKGAGLGLSICKRIVEMHGGRIWAESKGSEGGSSFHFILLKNGPAVSPL